MIRFVVLALALFLALAAPDDDKMKPIPVNNSSMQGYPESYNTSVYRGYLNLQSPDR